VNEERTIWLPFPPSVNNLFAHAPVKGRVRRFPTSKYKRWQRDAEVLILAARLPRYTEPVVIKLALVPPDGRARDASNYCKAVEDSLVKARVLIDDNQNFVKAVIPYWENPSSTPGVRVTIRPAKDVGKPALTAAERKALARLRQTGYRLVGPNWQPSLAMRGLLEKGYVEELPGLMDGTPQGFAVTEAD
jgi:Holliday junction resolvase RusA-like endonuclease